MSLEKGTVLSDRWEAIRLACGSFYMGADPEAIIVVMGPAAGALFLIDTAEKEEG